MPDVNHIPSEPLIAVVTVLPPRAEFNLPLLIETPQYQIEQEIDKLEKDHATYETLAIAEDLPFSMTATPVKDCAT